MLPKLDMALRLNGCQQLQVRHFKQICWYFNIYKFVLGCGGSLISPNGSIISPYYPEPYSRNTECYWKVTVSAGSVIRVIFADLDLEKHTKCLLDYVEVGLIQLNWYLDVLMCIK